MNARQGKPTREEETDSRRERQEVTCRRASRATRLVLLGGALTGILATIGLGSASALAQAPWWRLSSSSAPTILRPGDKEDFVFAAVSNLGDATATGSKAPIVVTDRLPQGLTAKAVGLISSEHEEGTCEPLPALRCSFPKDVPPYARLEVRVTVEVSSGLPAGAVENQVQVTGGETPAASLSRPLKIADEATPFGAQAVELTPENEGGSLDTRAGSHPFQLTTALDFNQTLEPRMGEPSAPSAPALLKDLHFDLPPGMIGDPQATPQCTNLDFSTQYLQDTNFCPGDSVIGAALVTLNEPANVGYATVAVPVFNLTPAPGEPARFGFEAFNVPVVLDTAVHTGGDYHVQVNVRNATTAAQILASQVTFWGEPGDPRHDGSRGWACIAGGSDAVEGEPCEAPNPRPSTAFLTLPTSCQGPLTATLAGDSWSGDSLEGFASIATLSGCGELPFTPSLEVTPETQAANTPTGLSVRVKIPQSTLLEDGGRAESDVRNTTLALPEGMALSPSAANGLQACTEQQIGFTEFNAEQQIDEFTPAPAECEDASKLGLVHIRTPLLPRELEGAAYLAEPAPSGEAGKNPFNSLAAIYLVAEEPVSHVLVKLAGEVALNENTLQAVTTFRNTPQVPFEELKIDLFGGPRGSLTTPPYCGTYALNASLTPWSGNPAAEISTPPGEFPILSGPGGAPCTDPQPFAPTFDAQSTNIQAGAFTPFRLSISRPDADQALQSVSVHLPPGIAALLSTIKPCPEPQASQGTCGAESLIGHTTVSAGLGPEPFTAPPGQVFITGPYHGAPFGLSIVTPAVAGPFNLGDVIIRSTINIDPSTAAVTIKSEPLPTQLKGIPLQLQHINVTVDRAGFEFNPTSCNPMTINGTLTGAQGGIASTASPFQVADCADLPFKPKLTASTKGQASKANGANFDVKVESKGFGQADIAKVRLQLPKALPARLTTLQKACTEGAFAKNPASCPEGSVIGQATIHTPVLSNPLTGPAYLVSHGGAAFPDVEFVLQGEGITLLLDGKTQIKNQITYSKFESAPDAPFTVFETVLPAGPHSALTANLPEKDKFDLCNTSLSMPTEIVAQNGAVLKQTTKIALQGCKKVTSSRPLSRAQLLKRALAKCRKTYRHARSRRIACERKARSHYAAKKAARKGAHQSDPSRKNRRA